MPKYFIYARKSTDDEQRQLLSIPAQIDELRVFSQKENLEVLDTFIESKTAKKPGRKIFNQMISRIENDEADGIISWHPFVSIVNC
ncbi:MAG: recombinase family protein [Patescibacteria group bacterium]|nr:recombinase family protein [Patescibacteria group bacterium]